MKHKILLYVTLAALIVASCGKDDDPTTLDKKTPENTAPVINNSVKTFTVIENIPAGTEIVTVSATDAEEDSFTFSIKTNSNNLFAITTAGKLTLAAGKSLSFATAQSHSVVVQVTDDNGASSSATFTINVTAVVVDPENVAPVIQTEELSAQEDLQEGGEVGRVVAEDEDSLTYMMEDDSNLFAIDSGTGIITLVSGATLDYETQTAYTISVTVSDGKSDGTVTSDIIINVIDVNEAPIVAAAYQFSPYENSNGPDLLGTIAVQDPEQASLSFNIIEGDPDDLFDINADGEIRMSGINTLDYETTPEYMLTVEVSDGTHTVTTQVTLSVQNLKDTLAEDENSFVTTWKTETNMESITIGIRNNLTYSFTIDWGDGSGIENISDSSTNPTHEYQMAGTYTVAIQGDFPAIDMSPLLDGDKAKLRSLEQWGTIQWQTMVRSFQGCANMVYNASDAPDLSQVTNMQSMFEYCSSFDGDLSNWDVSTITNMAFMFSDASTFNGNIGGWDVSSVTNMGGMFSGASSFNQDIGEWSVSKVTNMGQMFLSASAFDQNLNQWDVGNVTQMSSMFSNAIAFNGDISGWDVQQVTDMSSMFASATSFNQDIGGWQVYNVEDMDFMFQYASSFNANLNSWDVGNVIFMSGMFLNASLFNGDISNWTPSKAQIMSAMFQGAIAFDKDLGDWDISSVNNMGLMLDGSGLSRANYDNTLIGWANNGFAPDNVELGANGLTYCNGENARNALVAKLWTINGDMKDCN